MAAPDPTPSPWSEPTDEVERLLVECLADGEGPDRALARTCQSHPELADDLRRRFEALRAAGMVASSAPSFPERLGDFRLIERLGGGGMGVVYRAEQVSLSREVALKLVRPELLYFPGSRERFRREVEAVARLKHPGIVPIHAVGEEDGLPFYAMELVEGATIAAVLERLSGHAPESLRGAHLPRAVRELAGMQGDTPAGDGPSADSWVDACLEIVRQVAEALAHAHERGILHRDVKPSNIALTPDGRALLLDFGLSSAADTERVTRSGGQVGTLPYMAPEQVRGDREVDGRVDVYGLGVTLYELLTLHVPYQGETSTLLQARILEGRPDSIRARNRRVWREAELVCLKAMDPEPARRYVDATTLAEDLRRLLERRPVHARAPGALLRARRWSQRHPGYALAGVATFLLVAVAPTVLLVQQKRHADELADALEQERAALSESRAALGFLEDLLTSAEPWNSLDPDVRLRDLLERGVAALEALSEQPRLQGRLLRTLAEVHNALGLFQQALPLAERALTIESRLGESLDPEGESPIETLSISLGGLRRFDEIEPLIRPAYEAASSQERRARLGFVLARAMSDLDRTEPAEQLLREVWGFYSTGRPEHAEPWIAIGTTLCTVLWRRGSTAEAREIADACLELAREIHPPGHPSIASALSTLAYALLAEGDHDGAILAQSEALDMSVANAGPESYPVAFGLVELGGLFAAAGDLEQAIELTEQGRDVYAGLYGEGGPQARNAQRLIDSYRSRR